MLYNDLKCCSNYEFLIPKAAFRVAFAFRNTKIATQCTDWPNKLICSRCDTKTVLTPCVTPVLLVFQIFCQHLIKLWNVRPHVLYSKSGQSGKELNKTDRSFLVWILICSKSYSSSKSTHTDLRAGKTLHVTCKLFPNYNQCSTVWAIKMTNPTEYLDRL